MENFLKKQCQEYRACTKQIIRVQFRTVTELSYFSIALVRLIN